MGNSPQRGERRSELSRLDSSLRPLEHNKVIGNMLKKAHVKMDSLNASTLSIKKSTYSQMGDNSFIMNTEEKRPSAKHIKKTQSEVKFKPAARSPFKSSENKEGGAEPMFFVSRHSRNMSSFMSRESDFQEFSRDSMLFQKENMLNTKVMNPKQNSDTFKKRFMNLNPLPAVRNSRKTVFSNTGGEKNYANLQTPSVESSCELSFVEDALSGERMFMAQKEIQRKQVIISNNQSQGFSNNNNLNYFRKKEIEINCNFEENFFSLPTDVLFLILSFLIDEYSKLELISPVWYLKMNEVFEETFLPVDNDFIKKNIKILSLKKAFFSFAQQTTSQNQIGYRMDRNIIAEVLPCVQGK